MVVERGLGKASIPNIGDYLRTCGERVQVECLWIFSANKPVIYTFLRFPVEKLGQKYPKNCGMSKITNPQKGYGISFEDSAGWRAFALAHSRTGSSTLVTSPIESASGLVNLCAVANNSSARVRPIIRGRR